MEVQVLSSAPITQAAIAERFATLYRHDARGRLLAINQWDGGAVPRFHLIRTAAGNQWRFRADQPDELIQQLNALCESEPVLDGSLTPPRKQAQFEQLLSREAPIKAIWSGPAYRCRQLQSADRASVWNEVRNEVRIEPDNAQLLSIKMADWLPDVGQRSLFLAAIENEAAVAVCASVRISSTAHEAGVETHPDARRRGYAARVVRAWVAAVAAMGATPYYSTSWENLASQALASKLGFELIAVDDHIR